MHHRDCWEYLGRCSTFGCRALSYREAWQGPGEPGSGPEPESPGRIPVLRRAGPAGRVLPGAPGTRVGPSPRQVVDLDGETRSLTLAETPLELDTPLERLLVGLALLGALPVLVFGLPGPTRPGGLLVPLGLGLGAALLLVRLLVECHYVLENHGRRLRYHRRFLGMTSRWTVCRFDQIRRVGVAGGLARSNAGTWWEYGVVLQIPDGVIVEISPWSRDLMRVNGYGTHLARHLGVPFEAGEPEQVGLGGARGALVLRDEEESFAGISELAGSGGPWVLASFVAMASALVWVLARG